MKRFVLQLAFVVLFTTPGVAAVRWSAVLRQPAEWYGTGEAMAIAQTVLQYQDASGGWPKARDMTLPPEQHPPSKESSVPTIDNGATTTQLWLLARVHHAHGGRNAALRSGLHRGIEYLLQAQYPHGGWPQFFPLRNGYYRHVTYNDGAMVNVLRVLQAVAHQAPPFEHVNAALVERASRALKLGVQCILRTQVVTDGKRTAWCAQHDVETLEPAPARRFEPVSLSGMESVGILEFLMSLPDPDSAVLQAVHAGVEWLEAVKIEGWRIERPSLEGQPSRRDVVLVPDASGEPIWARFYEIGTNRPIFVGRDGIVRYELSAIEPERRSGYAYVGTWPRQLLAERYPRWRRLVELQLD